MSTDQISATEPAFAELASLRERYGPLMLFQSGGCCDGSSPLCLHEGELLVGPNDLLLGEIGGTPFYIDLANTNAGTGPPSRSMSCPGRPTRSRSKDLTASTSSAAPLPARHADVMMPLPTSPVIASIATVIASFLMVLAGVRKKQFRWRTVECPVCHHPRGSCTCRWL